MKNALTVGVLAIGILALAMVGFYRWQNRSRGSEGLTQSSQEFVEKKADYEGIYSAVEPLEAEGKKLVLFNVTKTETGLFGQVKLTEVGKDQATMIDCQGAPVNGKEVFLQCKEGETAISFGGDLERGAATVSITGKLLWISKNATVLEKKTTFQVHPEL